MRSKTGWKTLKLVPVKQNGSFVFTLRTGAPGAGAVRALFSGDSSHLPASAVFSFKVV
jgi:hypothetical protein